MPHGIWPSGDGSRVYVGLENQDAVAAIDTRTNTVIATIPIGQQPQALVYVPDAVPERASASGLVPLGDAGQAAHLVLRAAATGGAESKGSATVSVNNLGALDLLQMAASGLKPGASYTLWLATSRTAPYGEKEALATFKANPAGAQIAQAIGPLRKVLTSAGSEPNSSRFLLLTLSDGTTPILIQRP